MSSSTTTIQNQTKEAKLAEITRQLGGLHYQVRRLQQGPRVKSFATRELEEIIRALLLQHQYIEFYPNILDEIEVVYDGKIYNVTHILQNQPDFSQLVFDPSELDGYVSFRLDAKNDIHYSEQKYLDLDEKQEFSYLHYAEKLAISSYTMQKYIEIQHFLRNGNIEKQDELSPEELNSKIKYVLLTIAVAAHGLTKPKPSTQPMAPDQKMAVTYCDRAESSKSMQAIFAERIESCAKKTVSYHTGFTSTITRLDKTTENYLATSDCFTRCYQPNTLNPMGKYIAALSVMPHEEEVLFPPGTQFQYTDYKFDNGRHVFACIAVRSIEGINPFSYSPQKKLIHEIEIINKMLSDIFPLELKHPLSTEQLQNAQLMIEQEIARLKNSSESTEESELTRTFTICRLQVILCRINTLLLNSVQQVVRLSETSSTQLNLTAILDAMMSALKKLGLKLNKLDIMFDTKKAIKKIASLCNERYSGRTFYGNAALNRKILLDKDIAQLLTPYRLLVIFIAHIEGHSSNKFLLKRESSSISLAEAIYYGFVYGLEAIQHIPTNEFAYDEKQFALQQENYTRYTIRIVDIILQAAIQVGINIHDPIYREVEEKSSSLSQQFSEIEKMIDQIRENKRGDQLLSVPKFSADQIRMQAVDGFCKLCKIAGVSPHQKDATSSLEIVIPQPETLQTLTRKFISSNAGILNGEVCHLLYDRVHWQAAVEQNTTIEVGGAKYYLRDILREMIKQCDLQDNDSIIKKQLAIRFKIVISDLKDKSLARPAPLIQSLAARSVENKQKGEKKELRSSAAADVAASHTANQPAMLLLQTKTLFLQDKTVPCLEKQDTKNNIANPHGASNRQSDTSLVEPSSSASSCAIRPPRLG